MAEITLLVCDVCASNDDRNEATGTIHVAVEGKPYKIDLCPEHINTVAVVIDMITESGTPDGPRKRPRSSASGTRAPMAPRKSAVELIRSPGSTGCPVCGQLLSTPGNAKKHVASKHLRKIEEWTLDQRQQATDEARKQLAEEVHAKDQRDGKDQRHLSTVPSYEPSS